MGIRSRDYMKRPSDDDEPSSTPDNQLDDFLSRFLQKHPRFFVYLGAGFGALILISLLALKFSG